MGALHQRDRVLKDAFSRIHLGLHPAEVGADLLGLVEVGAGLPQIGDLGGGVGNGVDLLAGGQLLLRVLEPLLDPVETRQESLGRGIERADHVVTTPIMFIKVSVRLFKTPNILDMAW